VIYVVGGGVAGLVAARALVLGGAQVTLLEASDRLGGTVADHTVGGLVLDAGAESFATRRGTVAELATSLGLADDIVEPNPAGAWLQRADGTTVPLPATSLLGIPGVPLASDVMTVVGRRVAFRALLDELIPGTVGARSRTLGELVRKRMGQGLLDALVTPVVLGIHSRHPDELDLDRIAPGLRQALLREGSLARAVRDLRSSAKAGAAVNGIRGGVHRLAIELAADLERFGVAVRLNSRVTHVEAGAVQIGDDRLEGDVLVAAPLESDFESITLATLVVRCDQLDTAPRGTGVLTGGTAPRALTHATAKWPWLAERAGAGRHVIRLSYSAAVTQQQAVADAERLLGVTVDEVVDFALVEWRRPSPQTAAIDGVWATGEAVSGTGLAAVVGHATATAESMLETLGHL
jgi:oxygen-dependent protoporphyrinogen oxidase